MAFLGQQYKCKEKETDLRGFINIEMTWQHP